MKQALSFFCFLLCVGSIAEAHLQPPITWYVQFSSTVCIAKATQVKNGIVTFSVEEIIKGKPPAVLTLSIVEVPAAITLHSEWLLASTGRNENTLGWAIKGDYGWVNAPIQRVHSKIHLVGKYGYVNPSLAADTSKGLTLEQLNDLAKEPLPKY